MIVTLDDWRWPDFKASELACRHCDRQGMNAEFMDKIQRVRSFLAAPILVSSAYRCRVHDTAVGGNGNHPRGLAIDLLASGEKAHKLLTIAFDVGFLGVGIHQTGPHQSRFIHLDDSRIIPWIWGYPSAKAAA